MWISDSDLVFSTALFWLCECAVNKAYQYSSITSVTLLDCWTIPWVIILTWILLGTRKSLWQLSGAAVCVLGLCLVMFSDSGISGGGDIYLSHLELSLPISG